MEPVKYILKMYPRTAAHLMCEGGVDSVSPAEAATVIGHAKYPHTKYPHLYYEEWIAHRYGGDSMYAVSLSFKNRHSHREKDYRLARDWVELAIDGVL